MATKTRMLWKVGCEGLPSVWVEAASWELATVEAAVVWDVPWARVAAGCFLEDKKKVLGGVCPVCGRFYSGGATICEACRKVQETEAGRARQCSGRYFRRESREWRKRYGDI